MAQYFTLMAFKLDCQLNEAGYSLYPSLGAMTIAYMLAFESCEPLQLKPQTNTGKTNLLVQDSIISFECPSTCNAHHTGEQLVASPRHGVPDCAGSCY
ncbi:hypothetical protein QWZ13_18145 [Reinekea marina]|uniref:hypothetical protein n=1 Tax=Reinekea marina TaxID=1310421 RepID=UPI0025B2F0AA|nr:hypothetical protein [Reinekea marina]MDN3650832.1 hypothetical protein [Reinekea marina]